VVRKLGTPGHEELAMGAIASGGVVVWNEDVLSQLNIPEAAKERILARERDTLRQRESSYRGVRPAAEIMGKTVILVDDGLATGATMRAAVSAVKARRPSRIVIAVPTAPSETCEAFKALVDQLVCLITPRPFSAVGLWYSDFSQTTDEEVRRLLDQADDLRRLTPPHCETRDEHGLEPWAAG
jgi:putative phosphoribosyl transferase